MKKCEHHHLDIGKGENKLAIIECIDCGLIWRYNSLFYYWSDSFVGNFKLSKRRINGKV